MLMISTISAPVRFQVLCTFFQFEFNELFAFICNIVKIIQMWYLMHSPRKIFDIFERFSPSQTVEYQIFLAGASEQPSIRFLWSNSQVVTQMVRYSLRFNKQRKLKIPPGPVRGVHIHPSRPLLVTGGDDLKVKVWGTFRIVLHFTRLTALSRHLSPE